MALCGKSLRDVEVTYDIDSVKCENCVDKPCLNSCPVEAIFLDEFDNEIKISDKKCVGCILCRNACPYDAIQMETKLTEPIKENVPNINKSLCKGCGACVGSCKTGAIHLNSSGGEVYSEIDEDKCVRCGYCFRVCPTDAIKYGEILPRTVKGGKAIVVNQDKCIGCMTCTRVCPSKGALNVGNINKLPYINPAYCARCEECMHACPSSAIKYSSRKRAYASYSKIKTSEIISNIVNKDISKLSNNVTKIDSILYKLSKQWSCELDKNYDKYETVKADKYSEITIDITGTVFESLDLVTDANLKVNNIQNLIDCFPAVQNIYVNEERCIGCGECLVVCPGDAMYLEKPSPVHIKDNCVYCGMCVEACRFDVITLIEEFFSSNEDKIYFKRRDIKGLRNGKFKISHDRCQSCGICTKNCPVNALKLIDNKVTIDQDKCISCRQCEYLCPVNTIKIYLQS